ncbi:NADH dehydrogenase [ubiquinone] 1 alpha subcomplex assembly factor 4 isoform X2 [Puntigrus tetrazona]|uniref:NADH dehydrogenase [ubiquinone] 1 alpha subcomplex assembly factor 4 isoform X2 n=1 Tax=Puntigrus tetrazona TaxID=1606681 RepID=UPI001C89B84B|nr:NADH dehydrogenase [ubiquinone] 1 alpha subcomplex assembly factor 4 isoform X2 [Puntigrus tetrazona]
MGSRVTRLFRNFNIENRAHREISKTKSKAAPRHSAPIGIPQEDIAEINKKNDSLLSMLKDVYVESKDPVPQDEALPEVKKVEEETQQRALKHSLPSAPYGFCDITVVPKGKISLVEALTALNNHKLLPKTWTPEKLAEEYSLDPKDAKALTEFFFPFDVIIIPPKTEETKRIDS